MTLGRSKGCDISINWDYSRVSRRHARILSDKNGFILCDGVEKKSTYGTFVNGKRVGKDGVRLSNGDWIVLGGISEASSREALEGACTLLYAEGGAVMGLGELIDIQAKVEALSNRLEELDTELERGYIGIGRYTRLKTDVESQKTALFIELQNRLNAMGMADLSDALEEAKADRPEQETKAHLKEAAEKKGWGATILEQIEKHKGEIVGLIIAIAIELGKRA